ncbi:DUF357 domain-containing protein [Candidatus Woesearchaeota archaeon]|jgi:hypothetical protein|nr:DUF357 domain-containing protein [Candidatus Woesearchaeota archaeon]
MKNKITKEKLEKYFSITREAYFKAKESIKKKDYTMKGIMHFKKEVAEDFLDMIDRYIRDAEYFYKKKDYVNSFACLNYSHGWLDAGARAKIFDVNDSRLFTVD